MSDQTIIAKNLLENKTCWNCHYSIKGSFEKKDWNCRNKIRNTALFKDDYVKSPDCITCEDWFDSSLGQSIKRVVDNEIKLMKRYKD